MADAIGTTVGAMIGTSTVTTFIESSTGVEEGGRTGFTALVVGLLFVLSLLVVPLISAIPQYASYLALVVVGIIMLQGVTDIDWQHPAWAIAGGLTITVMPMTASISNGLAAGIMSYPLVKGAMGEATTYRPASGRSRSRSSSTSSSTSPSTPAWSRSDGCRRVPVSATPPIHSRSPRSRQPSGRPVT